jgi:GSCFA family.
MNPYTKLPKSAFWRPAVADRSMFEIEGLWSPKFRITPQMPVATYGSCFAQHIGNALKSRGFDWMISERAPPGMSEANAKKFNYNVFTSRTGNIYTTTLLRQWTSWALGHAEAPEEFWEKDGRFYDPFRPAAEDDGFESIDEVRRTRRVTIDAFRRSITDSQVFVFTLGLTESWINAAEGYEYPMCPGTVAGDFDESLHKFVNEDFRQVRDGLISSIEMMREANRKLRFLLTVSPVPLTATASDKHVLVATMYSKSVLRAVAGQLASTAAYIDYFPSYEIINSPVFKGAFFGPNQRNVTSYGVNFVMDHFFTCLTDRFGPVEPAAAVEERRVRPSKRRRTADEVCEEELLGAFGG